ncbi:hypothetical protein [Nocardia sp. NPDC024068]|uniref:hypothetical protein n=1 Tax=Nocardia sp. NPDC024068 TaxID=3157197 RepID=UPI00340353B6
MRLVNDHQSAKVRLSTPTGNGFLLLAAEIGRWAGPLPLRSGARRRVLDRIVPLCEQLAAYDEVIEATAFGAALRPPGEGGQILRRAGVRPARYDVVVLIRVRGVGDLETIRGAQAWLELVALFENSARAVHLVAAGSPARIADVDHGRGDWFLFNYFHSADRQTVLDVWAYTAGWFQRKTALPNSVPMQPLPGESDDYSLINHASWPSLRAFLPGLVLRPSFRSFVLANFAANEIAAQPIVYHRRR